MAKYELNPLLKRGFQKASNGPGVKGAFVPDVDDVTQIPEGITHFYYSGEDTADGKYINGYLYKHIKEDKTIVIPEHQESKTITLPFGRDYIDVLVDGYALPRGRYYKIEESLQQSIYFHRTALKKDGVIAYYSSYFNILEVGDWVWTAAADARYQITAINKSPWQIEQSVTLSNGDVLTTGGNGGSNYPEYMYQSQSGEKLFYAASMNTAGCGVPRLNGNSQYLYCDGLDVIPGTALHGRLTEPQEFTYTETIPEHTETILVDEWQQWDAQPRGDVRIISPDGSKYVLVTDSGIEIEGNAVAKQNLTVRGNLIVEGKEIVSDVEMIQSEDDFILLRFNNPAALGDNFSGLKFLNYDGNGATLELVVSGDGILRLGLADSLEPVATRDEAAAMEANGVAIWDADAQKLKTATPITNIVKSFVQTSQTQITEMNGMSQSVYDGLTSKSNNKLYVII